MNKTWVFMRGWGRESGHWSGFVDRFKACFPEDHVMTVDHAGLGRQRERAVPTSVPAMVETVRIQVPRLGTQYILFGHSLGGMVALDWMARHAPEVAGAVLINTSTRDTSSWRERLALSSLNRMAKIMMEPSEREREERIMKLVTRKPEAHLEQLGEWVKIARERPPSRLTMARQLWAASRFSLNDFPKDHAPILCLGSLGDELVDPACTDRLAQRLHADLSLHPWAGHEITLDDPDWVLERIMKWRKALN